MRRPIVTGDVREGIATAVWFARRWAQQHVMSDNDWRQVYVARRWLADYEAWRAQTRERRTEKTA